VEKEEERVIIYHAKQLQNTNLQHGNVVYWCNGKSINILMFEYAVIHCTPPD
jgi:hypothetical protein